MKANISKMLQATEAMELCGETLHLRLPTVRMARELISAQYADPMEAIDGKLRLAAMLLSNNQEGRAVTAAELEDLPFAFCEAVLQRAVERLKVVGDDPS